MTKYYLQVYSPDFAIGEDTWVDVAALGIHPDLAERLCDLGVVDYHLGCVPLRQATRLRRVMRLRRNLGVNLPGATIIVDLLERIEELQADIERLKRLTRQPDFYKK